MVPRSEAGRKNMLLIAAFILYSVFTANNYNKPAVYSQSMDLLLSFAPHLSGLTNRGTKNSSSNEYMAIG